MLICRFGPEGLYAAGDSMESLRVLFSDPFQTLPDEWERGRPIGDGVLGLLAPVRPGKIVGVGRNYVEHARELDNPIPTEPVLFLKAPNTVIGPRVPIVLPTVSERVEFEGEIAVVLRSPLRHATTEEAKRAVLGVTCACDVTARDLQRRDVTFARAKSFDTFCPIGPAIRIDSDLDDLAVTTRVNGAERQRGHVREMSWGILDLLVYISQMMTLEAADLVLTGTPAGVGSLADGDEVEVEIPDVGVLQNPVQEWRQG